ncbi:MAG: ABC transporter permease [Acidimicrobiia bacterium]|nr:ABC transporter permease [Acidimicrobiia bacterium]
MRTTWIIARKDLRQRIRDRSALIVGILAPLGLAAIFSFVFNPISEFEFSADYVVVDEDGGPAARLFVDQVLGGLAASDDITVEELDTVDAARALVDVELDPFSDMETADAAFVIPAGFSSAVASPDEARLEVLASRGSSTAAGVAVAIAEQFAGEIQTARVAAATAEVLGAEGDRADTGFRALAIPSLASVVDAEATSKILDGTTFYAAGLAIFFLFFTVQFGVNGLLEERHAGTLPRLLAAPIPQAAIIGGKAITAFVLGVVSMVVLVAASTLMFGAEWGNPIGVFLLILAGIFSAIGIMGIVGAFAKTAEQAGLFSSIIAVVLGFLGGTFFPIGQAGGILSQLRFITPHAWFMQGLGDLAGGNVADVLPAVVALVVFGLVCGAASFYGVRKGLSR